MWTDLLVQPKAVLGAYAGKAPSLNSFAPHSFRILSDEVALAGQFFDLPEKPPESWLYESTLPYGARSTYRAYCVFQFSEVRLFRATGLPTPGEEQDLMHGRAVGVPARCQLTELDDVFINDLDSGTRRNWCCFTLDQPKFQLEVEAGRVMVHVGRQALNQYGWPNSP